MPIIDSNHYIFEKVLQNPDICKEFLERLLKIKIEKLDYPEVEKTISPYYETKGVRPDVYIKDSNKVFDIELQNSTDSFIGLQQGISQGSHQKTVETARNFLSMGLSVEQVSQGTGLSKEAIIELVNINLK